MRFRPVLVPKLSSLTLAYQCIILIIHISLHTLSIYPSVYFLSTHLPIHHPSIDPSVCLSSLSVCLFFYLVKFYVYNQQNPSCLSHIGLTSGNSTPWLFSTPLPSRLHVAGFHEPQRQKILRPCDLEGGCLDWHWQLHWIGVVRENL